MRGASDPALEPGSDAESTIVSLVVCDDHAGVRAGYRDLLGLHPRIEVVGEAENGLDAVELSRELAPDVVLMDVRMPVMDGIEATRLIKQLSGETKVVLMSAYEQAELVAAARDAGADLFVLKGLRGSKIAEHVVEVGA